MAETYWLIPTDGRRDTHVEAAFAETTPAGVRLWTANLRAQPELRWGINQHRDRVPDFAAECRGIWRAPDWILQPAPLEAGAYHPRIWRTGNPGLFELPPADQRAFYSAAAEALVLFDKLNAVFRIVEPHPSNEDCYGHETRQLLILACTEVENAMRSVLQVNGYTGGARLSTNDYVKLLLPMQLDRYRVRLPIRPDWPALTPFAGWNAGMPTQSLSWYDAYNATKHDRESNSGQASLKHLISATSAVFILVAARFGPDAFGPAGIGVKTDDFALLDTPTWARREEVYIPVPAGMSRAAVPCVL